ncbi:MAG: hypothetical protein H7258_08775 [Ferruginibacter sp.]|nr:hypothetical protein [Ferruginibacter sp.]
MIEKSTVREQYAAMPDSELLTFAQEERYKLTAGGLAVLKEEFIRRKLDPVIFEQSDAVPDLLQKVHVSTTDNADHFTAHNWSYALEQKEKGNSNAFIIGGLLENGLEEADAQLLLGQMEQRCKQRLKQAEQDKLTGGVIFISGIAVNFLPYSPTANRLAYIIAWTAIIFGALLLIKGLFNRSRFKKILKHIESEKHH